MNKLKPFKFFIPPEGREEELERFTTRYNYFVESINKDLEKLNNLITEYNSAFPMEKNEILIEIYHYQKEITDKYPASFNLNCPEFNQSFQINLFWEMKQEFALLSNHSMSKAAVNDFDVIKNKTQKTDIQLHTLMHALSQTNNPQQMFNDLFYLKQRIRTLIIEDPNPQRRKVLRGYIIAINAKLADLPKPLMNDKDDFLEWIANMDTEKVTQLTTILLKQNGLSHIDRNSLCNPEEKGKYDNYQISFLGGTRSRNFEVKGPNGTFVLKVDNRWDAPKAMEAKLSAYALKDTIMPLLVDRVSVVEQAPIAGFPVTSSGLVITEYCPGGDIISYREKVAMTNNPTDLLKSSTHLFKQMIELLITVKNNNSAFPDPKNINWLIDKNGTLKLADTKSFLPANEGVFNPADKERYWYRLLHTPHISPPELSKQEPWDVGAAHAYILGKNLYQFLTGCGERYLKENEFFFHQPVFATEEGALLKQLIEQLIQPDPKQRISLEDALLTLTKLNQQINLVTTENIQTINLNQLKQECIALVDEIAQYAVEDNDSQMDAFIKIRKLSIELLSTEAGLSSLKQELEEIRNVSRVGQGMMWEIQKTIVTLREGAKDFFSIGKNEKADKIEAALKNIPIERRHLIMDSTYGDKDLQTALASQRHFGKLKELFQSDSSSEKTDSFVKAKEKMEKIKKLNEEVEQSKPGPQ